MFLQRRTGGLVIWRSGSSVVLFRGMAYKLPCVQSFTKHNHTQQTEDVTNEVMRNVGEHPPRSALMYLILQRIWRTYLKKNSWTYVNSTIC